MKLVQLIYTSQRTQLQDQTPMQDLRAIASGAARRNRDAEISGQLLANDRFFFQVLEGRSAALMSVFARINANRRHKNVTVKGIRVIEARQFNAIGLHITDLTGPYVSSQLAAARMPWFDPETLEGPALLQLAIHATSQGPALTEAPAPVTPLRQAAPKERVRFAGLFPWRAGA
jgi:Sensors of blue-light using FAD